MHHRLRRAANSMHMMSKCCFAIPCLQEIIIQAHLHLKSLQVLSMTPLLSTHLHDWLQNWLQDAAQRSNPIADKLLQNLYRWLSNPGSRLHDASLHKALAGLQQRLFVSMVREMKKFDAQLVAANFGSVMICTSKRNLPAAGKWHHSADVLLLSP